MGFKYRRKGRKVSSKAFFDGMLDDAVNMAMESLEEKIHSEASSIIDAETGKHAEVIVRRTGKEKLTLTTNGSDAFARELEKRLGFDRGAVDQVSAKRPNVYLAHASENKEILAEPLARKLIENGIDVWLDKWEIRSGDSLVQRMEDGLEKCSHFIVLLTPESIEKNWVRAEIDSGFMNDVDGKSKFIGLRTGVGIKQLTPFLRTRLCPEFDINNDANLDNLVKDIFDLNIKPELGNTPSFVAKQKSGLAGWSKEAVGLAKHLVTESQSARKFDPQTDVESCSTMLKMSDEDVRMGLLDLVDAGLVEKNENFTSSTFYPLIGLFVEFDRHFMDFNNREDALILAKAAIKNGGNSIDTDVLKKSVSDWPIRRFNSALNVLEDLKAVKATRYMGGSNYSYQILRVDDNTLRYIRRNS